MTSSENPDRQQGLNTLDELRTAEAFALLRPFAEAGDVEVQAHLGYLMLNGLHRFLDPATYSAWFMAASREELAALARDLKIDAMQALRWLENASAHGIGPASHNLAMAYLNGAGDLPFEQRRAKVKELLARARAQGFSVFADEGGAEQYLKTLESYAASKGCGMPWEPGTQQDES